jgi:hypothetical protein
MNSSTYFRLLVFSVSTLLVACGGGGSSNSTPDAGTTATLSGKAAKGIIINGNVIADELDATGAVKNSAVGSATTDTNGSYSLVTNSSYTGGPIQLTVSAGANTTMVCDAVSGCGTASNAALDTNSNGSVDFGEQYKPGSLSMTAMIPPAADGEAISVQITPFTHMAAQRAKQLAAGSGGSLDASTVAEANSAVSNMLGGVNILRTEPVDITDVSSLNQASPVAIAYAAMSASIAELADKDATSGEPDLNGYLNSLATDFQDGSFSATTLGNMVNEAGNALAQTASTDTSGVLTSVETMATNGGSGDVTPVASSNAGDSNIEKAYAFISDLRTWGTVIGNELDAPGNAFQTQTDQANFIYTRVSSVGDALEAVLEVIENRAVGSQTSDNLSDHTITQVSGSFSSGTISKTAGAGLDTYTVTNGVFESGTNSVSVNMVMTAPQDQSTIGPGTVTFSIQSASISDAMASISITSGDISFDLPEAITLDLNATTPPKISSISLDLQQLVITQKQELDSSSNPVTAVDPISYTGSMSFTAYIPYSDPVTEEVFGLVPGEMDSTGVFANTTGDSTTMHISASMPGANQLTPSNSVPLVNSYYWQNNDANNNSTEDLNEHAVYWSYSGDTFSLVSQYETRTGTYNSQNNQVAVEYSYSYTNYNSSGSYTEFGPFTSIQDWVSQNTSQFDYLTSDVFVSGQGWYSWDNSHQPDSATDDYLNFVLYEPDVKYDFDPEPASIGLQFSAQFNGLPLATVSLTGNRTALDTGTAMVTLSYGNRSIVFDASMSPTTTGGDITITNSDGVVLVLSVQDPTAGTLSGSVSINNIEIATVTETGDGLIKVNYNDGTFEIF